ncbi:hypothetical protein OAB00_00140 [Akkermansiaceae bacterium]|nr:hypothetical protein [Akkermansiaceae bacterium]
MKQKNISIYIRSLIFISIISTYGEESSVETSISLFTVSESTEAEITDIFKVVKSPEGKSYFPDGRESFYTKYYRAAMLPSLRFSKEAKGYIKFRLGVIPSFTKPMFFTYYRNNEGAFIEVKRLSLKTSKYSLAPNIVELEAKIRINKNIADNFEKNVVRDEIRQPLGSLTKRDRDMYAGVDGTTWILEVSTPSSYTMEDVANPVHYFQMAIDDKKRKELDLPKVNISLFVEFCDKLLEVSDMTYSQNGAPEQE